MAICLRIEKKSPNPQRRLKSLKHTLRVLALPSNWSPKTAHSLYQVHSRSSPTAGISTTPLYYPTTARRTRKGKVETGHQGPSKGSLPEAKTGCDMTPTGSISQEEARLEKTQAQASLTNPDNTHEIKQTYSGRIPKAPARLKDYFMT